MSYDDRNNPCVICQSKAFVWGHPATAVWFKPDEQVGDSLGLQSGIGIYGLTARVCRGCGNAQFFMKYFPDPEKEKNEA